VPSFEEYFAARRAAMVRFAYLLTGDSHRAQDVVQEVFARLYLHWPRVERAHSIDAYVKKAIVRQFLSWRRLRANGESVMAVLPDVPAPTDKADDITTRDTMWTALALLPRQQRAVMVLRYYEDLDTAGIAATLGCTQSTVRMHSAAALAKLRALIVQPYVPGSQA